MSAIVRSRINGRRQLLAAVLALAIVPASANPPSIAACKANGGTISTAGLAGKPHCVLPTKDGGKPCTSSSQCEAGCIASKSPDGKVIGRCKANTEPFGCHANVEDGKVQPVICVD